MWRVGDPSALLPGERREAEAQQPAQRLRLCHRGGRLEARWPGVRHRQRCGTVTIFYGSGSCSYFWKVIVPVPVPVPTFEKLRFRFRFQLHIWIIKSKFFKKILGKNIAFLLSKLFYKGKVYKFQQIYFKMWMKKMVNDRNQIHNFVPIQFRFRNRN